MKKRRSEGWNWSEGGLKRGSDSRRRSRDKKGEAEKKDLGERFLKAFDL